MAEEWISGHGSAFERGEGVNLALVLREKGELCGACGLLVNRATSTPSSATGSASPTGDGATRPKPPGRSFATGSSNFVTHRVHAAHFGNNPASGRVLRKVGMSYGGPAENTTRSGESTRTWWSTACWRGSGGRRRSVGDAASASIIEKAGWPARCSSGNAARCLASFRGASYGSATAGMILSPKGSVVAVLIRMPSFARNEDERDAQAVARTRTSKRRSTSLSVL